MTSKILSFQHAINIKIIYGRQTWWHKSIIPALWGFEAGRLWIQNQNALHNKTLSQLHFIALDRESSTFCKYEVLSCNQQTLAPPQHLMNQLWRQILQIPALRDQKSRSSSNRTWDPREPVTHSIVTGMIGPILKMRKPSWRESRWCCREGTWGEVCRGVQSCVTR